MRGRAERGAGHLLGSGVALVLAALLAWVAAALLWPDASRTQRIQVSCLALAGVAGLLWGRANGVEIDLQRVIAQNQLIISMMSAVTLLPPPREFASELATTMSR